MAQFTSTATAALPTNPPQLFPSHQPFISSWTSTPIPNLALSAGGLLALADLNTIAQRTAITGGSSWLDALVLAPGLHYQQAADSLDQQSAPALSAELGLVAAIETTTGEVRRYVINNIAMVNYLKRLWLDGGEDNGVVTLGVGLVEDGDLDTLRRRLTGLLGRKQRRNPLPPALRGIFEMDWLSHVLYLFSPLLTITAITFQVLLQDWWGLAFIVALMISRILNIWCIKERSRLPKPLMASLKSKIASVSNRLHPPTLKREDSRLTHYTIDLGSGRRVIMRGLDVDLQAVTTQAWMRSKTNFDGYLEAMSKLIVYLVAAFSGNLTQAGAIVLMALLLASAGLLGLSNAHSRQLQVHGRRVVRLRVDNGTVKAAAAAAGLSLAVVDGEMGGNPVEVMLPVGDASQ